MAGPRKQAWLVHHYCQGEGLADCMRLLCADIEVECVDQHSSERHRESVLGRIASFDRIVAEPSIARQLVSKLPSDRVTIVPTLAFRGYHPDCFVLRHGGVAYPGPTGSSQSLIAFCAFRAGLSAHEALALYRREVYEACGYLDQWEESREETLASFAAHGFDLRRAFVAWSRRGPFMHSIIHPRIGCLHDVARAILEREGMELLPTHVLPPDRLASHEVVPVYPEIAIRLGIPGGLLFKRSGNQGFLDLPTYVRRAFNRFEKAPGAAPHGAYVPLVERVQGAIGAFA